MITFHISKYIYIRPVVEKTYRIAISQWSIIFSRESYIIKIKKKIFTVNRSFGLGPASLKILKSILPLLSLIFGKGKIDVNFSIEMRESSDMSNVEMGLDPGPNPISTVLISELSPLQQLLTFTMLLKENKIVGGIGPRRSNQCLMGVAAQRTFLTLIV